MVSLQGTTSSSTSLSFIKSNKEDLICPAKQHECIHLTVVTANADITVTILHQDTTIGTTIGTAIGNAMIDNVINNTIDKTINNAINNAIENASGNAIDNVIDNASDNVSDNASRKQSTWSLTSFWRNSN